MPDRPEKLHEDTVSAAYGRLVNVCTAIHVIPANALFFHGTTTPPQWASASSLSRLHDLTHTHTLGSTPLDEGSDRRRDLYLTTHNTPPQIHMPPVGFEPATPTSQRLQNHALDRTASGISRYLRVRNGKCAKCR